MEVIQNVDLISREAAKEEIQKMIWEGAEDGYLRSPSMRDFVDGLEAAIDWLDDVASVDAAPVIHGYWFMRGGIFHCSVCDGKALWNCEGGTGGWSHEYTQVRSNRCPHCGAKMDIKS